MKKTVAILSIGTLILLLFSAFNPKESFIKKNINYEDLSNCVEEWTPETPVAEALETLGQTIKKHGVSNPTPEQIQQGKDLVIKGIAIGNDGRKTARQSKHFVCTHCHNVEREELNLARSNPDERLAYAVKNNLPFLQGTTLYGTVNRTSWYNGDYIKKYGDLVKIANKNLRESVQLCAVECSQGRALKSWELDAVVAYLWSIQLKIKDLDLSEEEWTAFKESAKTEGGQAAVIEFLESRYEKASPATFSTPWESKQRFLELQGKGNAQNGALVYKQSCQHCHDPAHNVTNLDLDDSKLTFKFLKRHFLKTKHHYSTLKVARDGTKPVWGYRPYMPHYTLERMSEQQFVDLQTFVREKAK